jgi:hypothetical protein
MYILTGVYILVRKRYLLLPPFKNNFVTLLVHNFFYFYRALFALILSYF